MTAIMYLEVNAFSLAVLLLIFLNLRNKNERSLYELKLFMGLLLSNAFILILDSAMWVVDGRAGDLARAFNLIISAMYFISNPAVCMLWLIYVDYQIYRDKSHIKKAMPLILIPAIINTAFAILSMFGNYIFYIDDNNAYHRGKLFFLMAFISYLYLIYSFIVIIIKKNSIPKKYFLSILSFAIPVFICAIIQGLFYGFSLIWASMTISILNVFINIQNDQLCTDHLTGLYNRRNLDSYLLAKTKSTSTKRSLAGIMMDVNSFKSINDSYGHCAGDKALEHTGAVLRKSLNSQDFIARYGGDEFVVILEVDDISDLINAVTNINSNIEKFNEQKTMPFNISLSIGYAIFDYKSGVSAGEFLNHIDNLMYEDKKNKKELARMKKEASINFNI